MLAGDMQRFAGVCSRTFVRRSVNGLRCRMGAKAATAGLSAARSATSNEDVTAFAQGMLATVRETPTKPTTKVPGQAPATAPPQTPLSPGASAPLISAEVLAKQNSETSQAIMEAYVADPQFLKASERLCNEIVKRDAEDGEKLRKGVQAAINKNLLPTNVTVEPTIKVGAQNKKAEHVADEIIGKLGDAPSKGCVVILQGLSGTGKGTTVAKLQDKLPNVHTWSNGNIFRAITLLAITNAEQDMCELQDSLKPEKLQEFFAMLEFAKFDGKDKFDVKIEGLGLKYFVSEVEKTVLKESKVGRHIPAVAEVTQGECVKFVADALKKMSAAGINVLVEGREQTLNYIRTPHRFELILDDPSIIGKRQAALQVGGLAWDAVGKSLSAEPDATKQALADAIAKLASV